MKVFSSPAPPPAWAEPAFEGQLAFLRCLNDKALPISKQDMFVEQSGVEWMVKDIHGGHFALLSRAETVTKMIVDCMEAFLNT